MRTESLPAKAASQKGLVIMTSYFDVSIGDEQQFRVALSKGGMTSALMKYVGNKGELGKIMVDALKAHIQSLHEEVESTYGYPEGWQLKPLSEQAAILAQCWTGLDVSHVDELAARYYINTADGDESNSRCRDATKKGKQLVLPKGMDGLVVIPKTQAIARIAAARCEAQGVVVPDMPTENLALWELLNVISAQRHFCDLSKRDIGPNRYRLTDKTKKAYAVFDSLPGDVMVLAAQTGLMHRGKCQKRASSLFLQREFGLCAFGVGCILFTHPERQTHVDHLWIDCAGSKYAQSSDEFSHCPNWHFRDDSLEFCWVLADYAYPLYGSASASHPECQSCVLF